MTAIGPGAVRATVLIPTHDHGSTLEYSVRSALNQTIEELEVFIVGDGVPDAARPVIEDLCRSDDRIRFFDNEKGPRLGELHRHAALQEAKGRVACYLSDDDLWLPDHVETMERLLETADFGNVVPFAVAPDQTVYGGVVDLAAPAIRQWLLKGLSLVDLSSTGHRMEAYRRLPEGWRTTPEGIYTDLYMWQQFLCHPDCTSASAFRITAVTFPSTTRTDWSLAERVEELAVWSKALADPTFRLGLQEQAFEFFAREAARHFLASGLSAAKIEEMEATLTWRLRRWLLSVAAIRRAAELRSAATARARRGAP
jgi:glycosyltransferase involved in cell wall biosynthesis